MSYSQEEEINVTTDMPYRQDSSSKPTRRKQKKKPRRSKYH
jgi:hypothetical protein